MDEVSDFSDLLEIDTVKDYVAQVAPITYSKRHFYYVPEVHKYLTEKGIKIEVILLPDLEPVVLFVEIEILIINILIQKKMKVIKKKLI